ncbi:hypothetical protein GLOIN_2v1780593 [Rhizophagus irregularis DAOM 181602=DAOM 197198]|nr:hypothetical protein GLOIN_2v1780593 [Rhizophagus irregularis DAOM 181602=DAOM 197198]
MVNNKALSPIKQQIIDGDIDWTFTKEWLNSNDQDAPIPYIECANAHDDNIHMGLCKEHSSQINSILIQAAHDLHELIITNTKDENFDLDDTIRSSSLFNATFDGVLPQSHPGYLLIHHLRFYRQRQKKRAPPPPAPDVSAHNSSPRRHYNHRHVATTPYYRDGGFYNNHAHIRWTTSNYLHSGYWTTYRDNIGFNNIDLFSILQNSFLKYVFDIR